MASADFGRMANTSLYLLCVGPVETNPTFMIDPSKCCVQE